MQRNTIGLYRLKAHMIAGSHAASPADAVKNLLAMQSQDYAGGLWSVGLRIDAPSLKAVEHAISSRQIVRTWPMRGTLHFLHADDVHWMVDLLAPRATAAAASRRVQQLGLTDAIVDEAEAVLRHELAGGKSIRRGDVVTLLQAVKGISIDNQHTQHLMRNFGERGILCFGPHDGKQPTFVLLDEWVEPTAPKPRDAALTELATRYFLGHGPATLKDFAGWGMMTMRDAKAGLEAARPSLARTVIDDIEYFHAPNAQPAPKHASLLLPGFDEFILGYKDRSAVLNLEHAQKVVPGNNGMFLPTVVDDGIVKAIWKRKILKSGITFTYEPFEGALDSPTESETSYQTFLAT